MSQPKRFDFWMYQKPCEHFGIRATMQMEFSEDGRFVFWEDYAALAAENERLRSASFVTAVPSEQYERVIKAGDAMYRYVGKEAEHSLQVDKHNKSKSDWLTAKEGKPLTKHEDDIRRGLRTK